MGMREWRALQLYLKVIQAGVDDRFSGYSGAAFTPFEIVERDGDVITLRDNQYPTGFCDPGLGFVGDL